MTDWATDTIPTRDEEVTLPKRLIELRDGVDTPAPNRGEARQRRLAQMEADISACADFVADLDRYATHLDNNPPQLVGNVVGPLIKAHVAKLRRDAVTKGRKLRDDLSTLRSMT